MVPSWSQIILSLALLLARTDGRNLSDGTMAGFQTTMDVTDYARMDLDQQFINNQVGMGTQDAFEDARNVYEQGAFSKSIATIVLSQTLGVSVEIGATVSGKSEGGVAVAGKTFTALSSTDTSLQVQYTSEGCFVGGLASSNPVTEGCFAPTGVLNVDGKMVQYEGYTPTTDTVNGRSLQLFSTEAETKMKFPGSDAFYPDYAMFVQYYGSNTYGDDIIQAAFLGKATSLQNGNIDFTQFGYEGRAEAVKKATAYMNTAMEIIRKLESGVYECLSCSSDDCLDEGVLLLNEAVALYIGSLEGEAGTAGEGAGIYSLAEKRAIDFQTLIDGKAKLNAEMFMLLNQMGAYLSEGNCPAARFNKEDIAKLMFVPMIQGTLRYAWILSADNTASEADEVEGMTFAACVLPIVAACSSPDADIIYSEIQSITPDFAAVKETFERTYNCLEITCGDVGGYWDVGNEDYYPGAAPCSAVCRADASLSLLLTMTLGVIAIFA